VTRVLIVNGYSVRLLRPTSTPCALALLSEQNQSDSGSWERYRLRIVISGANSFLVIGSTLRLAGQAGRVSGNLTAASFTLEMGNFDSRNGVDLTLAIGTDGKSPRSVDPACTSCDCLGWAFRRI